MIDKYLMKCEECGKEYEVDDLLVYNSPLSEDETYNLLFPKTLYLCECPHCHHKQDSPRFPIVYFDHEHKLIINADRRSNLIKNALNYENGKLMDGYPSGYKFIGVSESQHIPAITFFLKEGMDYRVGLVSLFSQCEDILKRKDDEYSRIIRMIGYDDADNNVLETVVLLFKKDGNNNLEVEPFDMDRYNHILNHDLDMINKVNPIIYDESTIKYMYEYHEKVEPLFVMHIGDDYLFYRAATEELAKAIKVGDIVKASIFNPFEMKWEDDTAVIDEIQTWNIGRMPHAYKFMGVVTEITDPVDDNKNNKNKGDTHRC